MKLAVAIWLLTAAAVSAAITARLEVSSDVLPGEAFTLSAYVTSDEPLLGATYRFADEHGRGFVIESRTLATFLDPITADVRGTVIPATGGPDLGALVENINEPVASGEHLLASYLVLAPNLPPGDYKITLGTQSIVVTGQFASVPIFASADVKIVPEPSSALLLGFLGFIRWRSLYVTS